MTIAKDFATQVGALAVGGTAFALGDPSGGTLLATPITALAALGLTLKTGCARSACAKAEQTVLKLMSKNPEFTDDQITRAKTILAEAPRLAELDPKDVTVHVHGKDLETALAQLIMRPLAIGDDDAAVHDIIQTALVASIAICKQDTEFRAALTLELVLETARKQGIGIKTLERIENKVEDVKASVDRVSGTVDDMGATLQAILAGQFVPLADMKLLATEFGAHDAEDQASLARFLKLKAEEFVALKAEVDAIDDGLKRLSNLKAAAQDAIARVDLEEVEELLSRVQEVELEEAAKTAELRANNALLRGKVDQAVLIFSAAADSFVSVGVKEAAWKRGFFAGRIVEHANRFGGNGYLQAAQMYKQSIQSLAPDRNPNEWALSNVGLAFALTPLGQKAAGVEGDAHLDEAIEALKRALQIWSKDDQPAEWAMAQNNLGATLYDKATRTNGPVSAMLFAEAVEAYSAALKVRTRAERPLDWAMTQNNLGTALQQQGSRTDGPARAELLSRAIAAHRAALEVYTRAEHPSLWATIQHNLGIALNTSGISTCRQEIADFSDEGIAAFRLALELRTRAEFPVDWALTQENIALALSQRAERQDAKNSRDDLLAALVAVRGALEVFEPEHLSYNHGTATRLRDSILKALDDLPE